MADAGDTSKEAKESLASLGLMVAPHEKEGVTVVDIDPDSSAAEKGMRRGDRILKANGIQVNDPEELRAAIETAGEKGRKSVLMLVRSGDNQRFVALPLKEA